MMAEGRQMMGFISLDETGFNDSIEIIDDLDMGIDNAFQKISSSTSETCRISKNQNCPFSTKGIRPAGQDSMSSVGNRKSVHNQRTTDSPDSAIGMSDDLDTSIDATFLKLAAEVERKHKEQEVKRREFHTRREVEGVHGCLTLKNCNQQDVIEAANAALHFSKKNRVAALDRAQPRINEAVEKIPEHLSIKRHCPVLNCGLGFTTKQKYERHLRKSMHSPCQPCRHLPDGRIVCDQVAFLCPVCGQLYNTSAECLEHMNNNDHNIFMKPLRLGGYICPQCLQVFPSRKICQEHIEAYSHWKFSYPFADDGNRAEPLHVPVEFIEKFMEACADVKWTLQCISCDISVEPLLSQGHIEKDHILSAEAVDDASDVFVNFLKAFTCIQCLRLFDEWNVAVDTIHDCGGSVKGLIIDNDSRTFQEYIRRLCLPLPDAINVQDLTGGSDVESDEEMQVVLEKPGTSSTQSQMSKRKKATAQSLPFKRQHGKVPDELSRRWSLLSLDDSFTEDEIMNSPGRRGGVKPVNVEKLTTAVPKQKSSAGIEVVDLERGDGDGEEGCKFFDPASKERSSTAKSKAGDTVSRNKTISGTKTLSKAESPQKKNSTSQGKRGCPASSTSSVSIPPRKFESFGGQPSVSSKTLTLANSSSSSTASSSSLCKGSKSASRDSGPDERSTVPFAKGRIFNPTTSYCGAPLFAVGFKPTNPWLDKPQINFANLSSSGRYQFTAKPSAVPAPRPKPPKRNNIYKRKAGHRESELPNRDKEPTNLHTMKQIIFLDLDNWSGFFRSLPEPLPVGTFVWGFFGGDLMWNEPIRSESFQALKRRGDFFLHPKCGRTKDAADFALVMTVGRLDERLPKHIPFTILSGDQGFIEVERQMSVTDRTTVVINPHHKKVDLLYAQIISVGKT